jgi:predicted amidohydrolase YtcJ
MKIMLSTASGEVEPAAAQLVSWLWAAEQVGQGAAIHVADLETLAVALGAVETYRNSGGRGAIRFEHVPLCLPDLAAQIAPLGIVVVTEPAFLYASGDRYLSDVETHLQPFLYPLRTLLETGVRVRAGSDAPVGPSAPLLGIQAAVERRTQSGVTLNAEQRLSESEAQALYRSSASQHLRLGAPANLVVLGGSPAAPAPRDVLATFRRGRCIWHRDWAKDSRTHDGPR